jgi:hypothetical protein
MNGKEIVQSKYFKGAAITVGVLIVALSSFACGIAVGIHKAKFSYAWGENYEKNFVGGRGNMMGGERGGMMGRFGFDEKSDGRNFRNAHGIAGQVLSVSGTSLIINSRENKENTVAVSDKTLINRNGETIQLSDIVKDDNVVVIGKPGDNGTVNADFIRVFKQGNTNQ